MQDFDTSRRNWFTNWISLFVLTLTNYVLKNPKQLTALHEQPQTVQITVYEYDALGKRIFKQ
jgi:hypothetical protein